MYGVKIFTILASAVVLTSGFRVARQDDDFIYTVQCKEDYYYGAIPLFPSRSTIIRSYNDEYGTYSNNERCTIQLETYDVPLVVTYTFRQFDLEYSMNCMYDNVCLHGYKYCGNTLENSTLAYVVPANRSQTIRFFSDSSVRATGFEVLITVAESESEDTEVEYTDRCGSEYRKEDQIPDFLNYNDTIYDYDNSSYPDYYYLYYNSYSYYQTDDGFNASSPNYDYNEFYNSSDNNNVYPDYENRNSYPDYENGESYPDYENGESYPDYGNGPNSNY